MAPTKDRVAVVCAAHSGNSGMHSVDLSAVRFFRECRRDFTLFTAQPMPNAETTFDGMGVELLTDPATFDDYTHVVYWGDFLNNPQYGSGAFSYRHRKIGMIDSHGHGYPFWRRLFTLRDRPALKARVFGIGGNFQHAFDEPNMAEDLRVMGERFAAFYPRDPFSTRNLCRFMPFEALSRVHQGMDTAFLLRPPDERPQPRDHFCWFFGRSDLSGVEALVEGVAAATGLRAVQLPRWLSLPAEDADAVFARQRNRIGAARFVLTDTYHLLINSVIMGTPVIPLSRPSSQQEGTLGDFKKQTLLEMLGLLHRLILVPESADIPDSGIVAAAARDILDRGAEAAQDYRLTGALTEKFRADLKRELFGITTVPAPAPAA